MEHQICELAEYVEQISSDERPDSADYWLTWERATREFSTQLRMQYTLTGDICAEVRWCLSLGNGLELVCHSWVDTETGELTRKASGSPDAVWLRSRATPAKVEL